MKSKNILIFSIASIFYLTGCSNKEVNLKLPVKPIKKIVYCNTVKINTNEPIFKEIFKYYKNNIKTVDNGKTCYLDIFVNKDIKVNRFLYTFNIKYKKDPCNYFVEKCINTANTFLCSKPETNKIKYLTIYKNFEYKNKEFYFYNGQLYKLYKKCKPLKASVLCKNYFIKLHTVFILNNKYRKEYFDNFEYKPCNYFIETFNKEIPFNVYRYNLLPEIKKSKNIVNINIEDKYRKELLDFIRNYFPIYKSYNIDLDDINFSTIKEEDLKNIIEKFFDNKITYEEYIFIKKYINKIKGLNYYKLKLIYYILTLKYEKITSKLKKQLLNEISNDIKKLNLKIYDTEETIVLRKKYIELKNIINNLFVYQ